MYVCLLYISLLSINFWNFCDEWWSLIRQLVQLGRRHVHRQILALSWFQRGNTWLVHWRSKDPARHQSAFRFKETFLLQQTSTFSSPITAGSVFKTLTDWWSQEQELSMAKDHLLGRKINVQKLGHAIQCPLYVSSPVYTLMLFYIQEYSTFYVL